MTHIVDIWIKTGILTVSLLRVKQLLTILHQELQHVMKNKGKHKENEIMELKMNSSHLLDIAAACQCVYIEVCPVKGLELFLM